MTRHGHRATRVREHQRAGSRVREHLRKLGPKDVRDIIARPYTNYVAPHELEDLTGNIDEVLMDWIEEHPGASIGDIDAKIVSLVLEQGRHLPPAQQVEVIDKLRACYRDPTTPEDVRQAVKVLDSYYGAGADSQDDVEVIVDRAYDNAYDVLASRHSFVRLQHQKELDEAMEDLRASLEEDLEGGDE